MAFIGIVLYRSIVALKNVFYSPDEGSQIVGGGVYAQKGHFTYLHSGISTSWKTQQYAGRTSISGLITYSTWDATKVVVKLILLNRRKAVSSSIGYTVKLSS